MHRPGRYTPLEERRKFNKQVRRMSRDKGARGAAHRARLSKRKARRLQREHALLMRVAEVVEDGLDEFGVQGAHYADMAVRETAVAMRTVAIFCALAGAFAAVVAAAVVQGL